MKPEEMLALARQDLGCFGTLFLAEFELSAHVRFLLSLLERVVSGEEPRVLLSCPPRHAKTTLASILAPAFFLGKHPRRHVVVASHSQELADLIGRRVRNLMLDPRYLAVFPEAAIRDDSAAASRFDLAAGGGFFGIGKGGGLTGRPADLAVLDDVIKDAQEAASTAEREVLRDWFRAVLFTRLEPAARVIVIGARWAMDDLSGWLAREFPGEGWREVNLPALAESGDPLGRAEGEALWPRRYPAERLRAIREQLGPELFSALYQGRPVPPGGGLFKAEWFATTYREVPTLKRTVTAWDTAYGKSGTEGDFSAAATIAETEDSYLVIDCLRERLTFPELRRRMIGHAERFNPSAVLIEDSGAGVSLLQELRAQTTLPVVAVKPETSKVLRAQTITGLCEAGKVRLPETASWKTDLLEELLSFPHGAHDDLTDAFCYALRYLKESASPGQWFFASEGRSVAGDRWSSY